jgi:hypothetical protein
LVEVLRYTVTDFQGTHLISENVDYCSHCEEAE